MFVGLIRTAVLIWKPLPFVYARLKASLRYPPMRSGSLAFRTCDANRPIDERTSKGYRGNKGKRKRMLTFFQPSRSTELL